MLFQEEQCSLDCRFFLKLCFINCIAKCLQGQWFNNLPTFSEIYAVRFWPFSYLNFVLCWLLQFYKKVMHRCFLQWGVMCKILIKILKNEDMWLLNFYLVLKMYWRILENFIENLSEPWSDQRRLCWENTVVSWQNR